MAFAEQVLDNPISGERFIFHQTAADTGGKLLTFDLVLAPDGQVPGGHVYPVQQERFWVLAGTIRFRKGRSTVVARAGDEVDRGGVGPRRPHHPNRDAQAAGAGAVHARVRPGGAGAAGAWAGAGGHRTGGVAGHPTRAATPLPQAVGGAAAWAGAPRRRQGRRDWPHPDPPAPDRPQSAAGPPGGNPPPADTHARA